MPEPAVRRFGQVLLLSGMTRAGMTAMDTQSTRDARGAGFGGNAKWLKRPDDSEQPMPIEMKL